MRRNRIKFDDKETRTLLALLRMSGMGQYQVSQIIGTTVQNISHEEGEPRYRETVRELVVKLAKEVLDEDFLHLFEGTDNDSDDGEPAINHIKRGLSE